jgi:long-chain fatty acid transport protein
MTRSRKGVTTGALFALGLSLVAPRATAAGFALFEQGARGMGFAGAFTAQSSDPSAIFHNAAGIAFLKGRQFYLGGTLVNPSTSFTGENPYPGAGRLEDQNVGATPFPSLYYTQALSDRLVIGAGLHVPFGLKTEWQNPETFTGRYISTRAQLKGFALNPTIAYKLADRFAIGGGLDIRFTSVQLDRFVPAVNPFTLSLVDVANVGLTSDTATDFGFNLGVLAKPSESWSVGASYRHKVKQDYAGAATFTLLPTGNTQFDTIVSQTLPSGAVPVTTSVAYPSLFSVGLAYKWNDWTFEGDANYYGWSSFDTLPITIENRPELSSIVEENYSNVWQFRFGAERVLNEVWSVRGGYFFDKTPSPVESVSPLLPDASRNGFAAGATWRSGRLRIDGASWYVKSKTRSTEGVNRDQFDGTYESSALTLGLSLGWSF